LQRVANDIALGRVLTADVHHKPSSGSTSNG